MKKVLGQGMTSLEKEVHKKLSGLILTNENIKIIEAASYCNVSPSKISKLARKMGFDNFKQYKLYLSGKDINLEKQKKSTEIERLIQYLETFDMATVDEFISVFQKYEKIVLYGLGPSFITAEYFAYKLATVTNKSIQVSQSEDYVPRIADENTLLIVFSVTGTFSSFDQLFIETKAKKSNIMLVLEEYVNTKDSLADYIFYLSKYNQRSDMLAFEKTRTVFFIFLEEVIAKLMSPEN